MAYKSILSILTDMNFVAPTLAQGMALTAAQDAHYDVLCLGLDRTQMSYSYGGANALITQEALKQAQSEAETLEDCARELLRASDLRWAVDSGAAPIQDLTRHAAARARFADLVVLPKPYGAGRSEELAMCVEAALFEGQAPVLVVPEDASPDPTPKRISIAWNESAEALVATRAALPFLRQADTVHVVVIDPPTHGPNRSDPGGLLSQFLARHGVRVEIEVLSKTLPRVSDILVRHAQDNDIEMLVMGAYGHSRFREAILGGATRNMLERAHIPVFMAH